MAASTRLALLTLVCEEAVSCGAPCNRRSPFHCSVEDKWAGIPQFSSLAYLMTSCPPHVSPWRPDRDMKRCPRSFSAEIDCSFIPFASRWCTNYDLDIISQRGLECFLELRRSSKTRNEAASKHSASFTGQLHVIVSQLFNFFYPLWFNRSSGKAAAPPVTCRILSWQFSEMIRVWLNFSAVWS